MEKIDSSFFNAIGKTIDQCNEKYGLPIWGSFDFRYYRKNTFRIQIEFSGNKAFEVTFQKSKRDISGNTEKLSYAEIQTILKENCGEKEWILFCDIRERKVWITEDKKLYAKHDKIGNFLYLAKCENIEQMMKINEALLLKKGVLP